LKDIIEIDKKIIKNIPYGVLIKSADRLYFIQDYELRYISSSKALKKLNLKRKNIIVVAPEILDDYEEGEPLK
jgi:hypothetical protein